MSDPISGSGLAGIALTGASVYGLLTGTDYGVVLVHSQAPYST